MDRLPMELILEVLEHAGRGDLRSAARVSRRFYRAAQVAGCALLVSVHLGGPGGHEVALARFDALVEHGLGKPAAHRPGLALRLFVHDTTGDFEAPFERVLRNIDRALPLMVALDVYVPAGFTDRLYSVRYAVSAPRLRSLVLCQVNDGQPTVISPPVNLFAATASRLRTLTLGLQTIDSKCPPVAVFHHIDTAHLILYRPAQRLHVSRLLPRVRSLIVTLEWDERSALLFPQIDLSGLRLRYLALDGHPEMSCELSGIDVRSIPILEGGLGAGFADGFWDTTSPLNAPMSMCLVQTKDPLGRVVSATSLTCPEWTRVAYGATNHQSPALETMPGLAIHLTVILMECGYLRVFLNIDVPLPALEEVIIEVSGGLLADIPEGKVSTYMRWPALRSLTLFVQKSPERPRNNSLSPFALRVERVTTLGELLRLEERPSQQRAILRLVKGSFVQPMAAAQRKRLEFVFPTIEYVSEPDGELLRLAASSSNQIRKSLTPYPLVRYP